VGYTLLHPVYKEYVMNAKTNQNNQISSKPDKVITNFDKTGVLILMFDGVYIIVSSILDKYLMT
jgi:hypothetical protein